MCGRFTLIRISDFTDLFPWIAPPEESPPPRYNIAPTQAIAVVANRERPKIEFFHWGLVPSWAKEMDIGSRMINARAESLSQKPAFRTALRRRRCLIPASGFYEWRKVPGGKAPMYIQMESGRPFAFAGLWDEWHDPGGMVVPSCTIITVEPNALLASIHNRMPAILRQERYRQWLGTGEHDPETLRELLTPYPADEMRAMPVSAAVNSPSYDKPDCTAPVGDEPPPRMQPVQRRRMTRDEPGLFG